MTATIDRPVGMSVRRNRITREDAIAVAAVAVVSAIAGALTDAQPTASGLADTLLTAALCAAVAWSGASSPWWVLTIGAGVAALVTTPPGWVVAAGVAVVISAVIGAQRYSAPAGRAVAAGLTVNALLHWDDDGRFGLSALVTAAVAATIVATGVLRRRRFVRRRVYLGLIGVGVVVGAAVVGAGIAVALAYGDLRDGENALRTAAEALGDGEVDRAVAELQRSEEHLAGASERLGRPWAQAALAVPVLGQHLDVVATVADEGAALSSTAATSVAQVDVDTLQVVAGTIDLAAIEVLATPLGETQAALQQATDGLADARSRWLVPPVGDRVDEVRTEIDDLAAQNERALGAVELAPSMLGRDEPRTYFVAFTTPAEARGLGGFMGAWAELRVEGGRVEVVRTMGTSRLTAAMDDRPVLDGPPDYIARYGQFGAGGDGEPVSVDFWSNVTVSPDFPSTTEVFAQLYPASGGRPIDGAIAVDVEAIAGFLELTGPIRVPTPDGALRLGPANAADYLLREQYADFADDDVRDAVIEEIIARLLGELFGGSLPGPRVLADALGPAMDAGRIVMWTDDPADQALLDELGVSGRLPAPTSDGLAVVSNNGGANKLDAYLGRTISYEATVDEETGEITSTATIRLTNDAPTDLPADVGGNPFDLPPGTNRMYLSVYSPWGLTSAEIDGQPTGMEPDEELGWNVYSRFVEIPPGGEVTLTLGFAGELDPATSYELLLRSQPLAAPDRVTVEVRTTDGAILHSSDEARAGLDVLTGSSSSAS